MFRLVTAAPAWELWKWCAYALIVIIPGSLLAIMVWWLVRVSTADLQGMFERLRYWWRQGAEERYLAGAADHAELERRIRALERASGGPVFVTFNH